MAVLVSGVAVPAAVAQVDPAVVGAWSIQQSTPFTPIHAHMLPTGKVMYWDSYDNADHAQLWDPATGSSTPAALAGYNIFCSGFSFLADGQLLVTSGHAANYVGLTQASLYNPFTDTWKPLPAMSAGRWYPTNTTLANGDALVVSGQTDLTVGMNPMPEVFQASTGTWRSLTGANLVLPFYPYMYLAPNGAVFEAGPNQTSRYLSTAGAGAWSVVGDNNFGTRTWGSSAMYEIGKVIMSGGSSCAPYERCDSTPTRTAEVIDLNSAAPAWSYTTQMAYARKHHNMTILPDGKVFVSGGSSGPEEETGQTLTSPVYPAEMWDPSTQTWTTMASLSTPRSYHSVALLLPDGRVFSGGGQGLAGQVPDPSYEVYSPPYLFKGARPTVSSAPATVFRGQTVFIGTPDYSVISKVTMLAIGTVTHSFNAGQRINVLPFARSTNGLNVTFPSDSKVSPPGYYMLFLLNGNGVPSVAKIIRLDAQAIAPPPAPSSLTAAATTTKQKQVNLAWQDNSSNEDGFRIERSTDGVKFTVVGTVGPNVRTFADGGLKGKVTTYSYRIQAYNAAGSSAYSNLVSISL